MTKIQEWNHPDLNLLPSDSLKMLYTIKLRYPSHEHPHGGYSILEPHDNLDRNESLIWLDERLKESDEHQAMTGGNVWVHRWTGTNWLLFTSHSFTNLSQMVEFMDQRND